MDVIEGFIRGDRLGGPIEHILQLQIGEVLEIRGSEIIAPTGQVLAKAKTDGDELVVATLDMEEVGALRKKWDFLADRRPDTYAVLVHEK